MSAENNSLLHGQNSIKIRWKSSRALPVAAAEALPARRGAEAGAASYDMRGIFEIAPSAEAELLAGGWRALRHDLVSKGLKG